MEEASPIDFNAEEVNALLDVILKTKDMPNFASLGHAAMANLAIIANEIQKVMAERVEEAKKEAEAETARTREKEEKPAQRYDDSGMERRV